MGPSNQGDCDSDDPGKKEVVSKSGDDQAPARGESDPVDEFRRRRKERLKSTFGVIGSGFLSGMARAAGDHFMHQLPDHAQRFLDLLQ
jgi:hypothetical protein